MDDYTLYDILGVAPTASVAEITRAYRRIVKNLHPDATGTAHTARLFSLVQHAREVLTDPTRRAAYDRDLADSGVRASASGRAQSGARSSGRDTPRGPDSVEAATVAEAMRAFDAAVVAVPHIDMSELSAAVAKLKTHWAARGLAVSPRADIAGVLRANLERDSTYPGLSLFLVEVLTQDKCVQVQSVFADQSRAFVYRIWNPPGDSLALFGSAADTILDLGNPANTGARSDRPAAGAPAAGHRTAGWRTIATATKSRRGLAVLVGILLLAVLIVTLLIPARSPAPPVASAPPLRDPEGDPAGQNLTFTVQNLGSRDADLGNGALTTDNTKLLVPDLCEVRTVDTATGSVGDKWKIQPNVCADEISISPDGQTAYVANRLQAMIFAVNLRSKQVEKRVTIPGDERPTNIATSLDGKFLVAVADTGLSPATSTVYLVDTASFALSPIAYIPYYGVSQASIAISPGSDRVYLGGASSASEQSLPFFTVVHIPDRKIVDVPCPLDPVSYYPPLSRLRPLGDIALSPDGRWLYGANLDELDVIDTANNTIISRTSLPGPEEAIAVSADGRYLFVLMQSGKIVVYRTGPALRSIASTINFPPVNVLGTFIPLPDDKRLFATFERATTGEQMVVTVQTDTLP